MSKDVLLIIGAGKHQRSLIETARKRGFYTIAVDQNPEAFGFDYCDEPLVKSAYDYESLLKLINQRDDRGWIVGVMTQAARGCILTVATISEKLGTRHLNVETVKRVLSKAETTREFNTNTLIGVYKSFEDVRANAVFPCVVKVEGLSGGLGVHKVTKESEIDQLAKHYTNTDCLILERYVEGQNFGIVGIKNKEQTKVYGIIEKFLNDDLTIDSTVFPAQISEDIKQNLLAYVDDAFERLGLDFGPFQLEVIADPQGQVHFIECEPSVLGSYISEIMIPAAGANDMIGDSIDLVVNGSFDPALKPNEHVCVQKYYYAPDNGNLEKVEVVKENKNVVFKPFLSIGDHVYDKRLYVANSVAVSSEFENAKRDLDAFDVKIKVGA